MGYVIQDTKSGRYVAPLGSEHSFTPHLQHARVFRTREDAERERCEYGERVLEIRDAFLHDHIAIVRVR